MLDRGDTSWRRIGHRSITPDPYVHNNNINFSRQGYQHFDTSPAPPRDGHTTSSVINAGLAMRPADGGGRGKEASRMGRRAVRRMQRMEGISGGADTRARATSSSPGSMGLCTMNQFFPLYVRTRAAAIRRCSGRAPLVFICLYTTIIQHDRGNTAADNPSVSS